MTRDERHERYAKKRLTAGGVWAGGGIKVALAARGAVDGTEEGTVKELGPDKGVPAAEVGSLVGVASDRPAKFWNDTRVSIAGRYAARSWSCSRCSGSRA
jgi:hypothetical protein